MEKDLMHSKLEVEIQIVDHCNQNCDKCNHFSNLADKWFMTEEEFQFDILKIKEVLIPAGYRRLMILGGEPFLHPKLKEFCKFAHDVFADVDDMQIDVLTNGLILNTLSADEMLEYSQYACMVITPYPNVQYSETFEREARNQEMGFLASHLFFTSPSIKFNKDGESWKERRNCPKHQIPCLFIRDYKMYMCPFSGCVELLNGKIPGVHIQLDEKDYLDMRTLTIEKVNEFRENGPATACKYCDECTLALYWTKNKYTDKKTYESYDCLDLFLNDYDRYNDEINGNELLKKFLEKNFIEGNKMIERIDPAFSTEKGLGETSRFAGNVDIIVPIHKTTPELLQQLEETLLAQTIIKSCHVYIVCDDSEFARDIFKKFYNRDDLYITLLKTPQRSGPGVARQLAIDNSFNPYIFFLDADDKLIDPQMLENMYKIAVSKHIDVVSGITRITDTSGYEETGEYIWDPTACDNHDSHCLLYSRQFLENNNIRFNNYFFNEDADWNYQVTAANPTVWLYKKPSYEYIKNLPTSIGHEYNIYDMALYRILLNMKKPSYRSINELWFDLLLGNVIPTCASLTPEDFDILFTFTLYFGSKLYQTLTEDEKNQINVPLDYQNIILDKIRNNDIVSVINDEVYEEEDMKQFILQYIQTSNFKDNIYENLKEWL